MFRSSRKEENFESGRNNLLKFLNFKDLRFIQISLVTLHPKPPNIIKVINDKIIIKNGKYGPYISYKEGKLNVKIYGKESQETIANECLRSEYFFYPTNFLLSLIQWSQADSNR